MTKLSVIFSSQINSLQYCIIKKFPLTVSFEIVYKITSPADNQYQFISSNSN